MLPSQYYGGNHCSMDKIRSTYSSTLTATIVLICFSCSGSASEHKDKSTIPSGSFSTSISWIADTTHSSLQFKAKHTVVHDVIGWIDSYRIEVTSQMFDFADASISATVDLRTLMMPNMDMVRNLEQVGMFDVQQYPEAHFKGRVTGTTSRGDLQVSGQLQIKDIEAPFKMKGTFNGYAHAEARGLPGFTIHGAFNRYDFNIGAKDTSMIGSSIGDSIYFTANLRLYVRED